MQENIDNGRNSPSITNIGTRLQRVAASIKPDNVLQAQGYDSVKALDLCISELKTILEQKGEKLPKFLKEDIPAFSKDDTFEIAVKICYVAELANRIAHKMPQGDESKKFFAIKLQAIDVLSKLKNIPEITYIGCGTDLKTRVGNYSLQFGEKNEDERKYAVISWHVQVDNRSPYKHLEHVDILQKKLSRNASHPNYIESQKKAREEDPKYKEYEGVPVTEYNPPDRTMARFGMEDRYNEVGLIVLKKMLMDRTRSLEIRRNEEATKKIAEYENGIKQGIASNYSEGIDDKLKEIRNYYNSNKLEEKLANVTLIHDMLKSLNFGENMTFENLVESISCKLDVLFDFEGEYEEKVEEQDIPKLIPTGYRMLSSLEKAGVPDFEKGMEIIKSVNDNIFGENSKLSVVEALVEKLAEEFSGEEFNREEISKAGIEKSDIIEMAIIRISVGVKDHKIGSKDFMTSDRMTSLVKSVKEQVKARLEEIVKEDDKGKFPVAEVLKYIDEKQCDRYAIMQVADELLAFSHSKSEDRSQNPDEEKGAEQKMENMSARSILTLRKKMKEEGFIGGGRY